MFTAVPWLNYALVALGAFAVHVRVHSVLAVNALNFFGFVVHPRPAFRAVVTVNTVAEVIPTAP